LTRAPNNNNPPAVWGTGESGYRHRDYARSFEAFGRDRLLPSARGWVLERDVVDTPYRDAMGCYPLFSCGDWSGLEADLAELARDCISVALVADPFDEHGTADDLERLFGDRVVPLKQHYFADLDRAPESYVTKHHRYYARRALDEVAVDRPEAPSRYLDEWTSLYSNIVDRFNLKGLKAFSKEAFRAQLGVPGIVMLRALHEGEVVAAHLWYEQGSVAHSHLAATTPLGYDLGAPYALHWAAIEYFTGRVSHVNFGGGAGADDRRSGLSQFKQGWSTGTRTAYFCGKVLNAAVYAQTLDLMNAPTTRYFPAYRAGELI
jgi:hypothetical protein